MQIYRVFKKQWAPLSSAKQVSSVTGGIPEEYVQSHVDGEVGRSKDAVQQQ